jgi:hypothetical protein
MKEVLDLLELANLQAGQTDGSDESDQINIVCGEGDQPFNSPVGTKNPPTTALSINPRPTEVELYKI